MLWRESRQGVSELVSEWPEAATTDYLSTPSQGWLQWVRVLPIHTPGGQAGQGRVGWEITYKKKWKKAEGGWASLHIKNCHQSFRVWQHVLNPFQRGQSQWSGLPSSIGWLVVGMGKGEKGKGCPPKDYSLPNPFFHPLFYVWTNFFIIREYVPTSSEVWGVHVAGFVCHRGLGSIDRRQRGCVRAPDTHTQTHTGCTSFARPSPSQPSWASESTVSTTLPPPPPFGLYSDQWIFCLHLWISVRECMCMVRLKCYTRIQE